MNHFNKIVHFLKAKRKQIIFALFALLCYILDNDGSIGILKSAAPVVAAAAVSSSVAAGGTAAAGTAASASAAGTAATSAGAASSGAVGTAATSSGAMTANGVSNGSAAVNNRVATNMPRNTNPNAIKTQNLSSNSINASDTLGNKSGMELNSETSKEALKDSSISEVEEENKKKKNFSMNVEPDENKDDDYEERTLDNSTKVITEGLGKNVIGCVFGVVFILIFSIPLIILLLVSPTSSSMSQVDCSIFQTSDCVEEDSNGNIINKLGNLFKYGAFGTNAEVISKKAIEVSDKIKQENGFIVNMPLLMSSLLADGENLKTDLDNAGEYGITNAMMERLEYIEELARLQITEDYVVYNCNMKLVNGEEIYYKTTNYDNIDPQMVPVGECNSNNVGQIFKEITTSYDEDAYFEKLEQSEVLDLIYFEYVESDSFLISKVKMQYQLYKSLYLNKDEENYPYVPETLIYDENVNLQAPLKGSYYITSPFGNRTGEFAGMHNGIDLVASDKSIYAAGDGVVTRSNVETEGGNVIEITHTASNGNEYVSQYAHLSQRLVSVGDVVKSGDIIGIMGDTGTMASGVHLHFSMWTITPKEYLNPKNLFTEASNY